MRASGLEPREARLLLAEATGFSQSAILAFDEKELPEESRERFSAYTERRKKGEPIAYILGHKEFYSLELSVNPTVLIPRPETELLVELALQRRFESMVDLGTGSGAVALAIKRNRPNAGVIAVEASAAALVVARRNAVKLGLEVDFRHGRWFEPLGGKRFDLIVSNPPYVSANDPHLAALVYEPREALVSGEDGLEAIRAIAGQAPGYLVPGAWLLLEHGMGQDQAVRLLLQGAGLEEVATWPDLAGVGRVTGGKAGGKR